MSQTDCHVVHLVYRLAAGGVESVVAQLVKHLPHTSFRHTVIALLDIDPAFSTRLNGARVELVSLNKRPGQPFWLYPTVYRLLRRLKPDVVHSYNLAAMEFLPVATLARVPLRIHGEHGMDSGEINGKASRYRLLRRLYRPFVTEYVAVSTDQVGQCLGFGAPSRRLHLIQNGVDTREFRPRRPDDPVPVGFPFRIGRDWVIGTVGRQAEIKNPLLLVDAFVALVRSRAPGSERLRLAMVGEGPLQWQIAERVRGASMDDRVWLPGVRTDVAEILRCFDCFVLPSLSEATSCALLEAMATGLVIVATDVGGTAEVLEQGRCGVLVDSGDEQGLAAELLRLSGMGSHNRQAARALSSVKARFGLADVMQRYGELFLRTPGGLP